MSNYLKKTWKENRAFVVFVVLMFIFRSAVADWNHVPTGSMKPTILEGDHIFVNKMAYDIRFPFTHVSLLKLADPKRGDIVIFDSSVSGKRLVKRTIGIPGDVVAMHENVLYINGQALNYLDEAELKAEKTENLLGQQYRIRTLPGGGYLSSFAPVRVPEGHYLVLGDNRDNSSDSRVIGFIPRQEIVGRSSKVVLSLDYENYYLPRGGRFLHSI